MIIKKFTVYDYLIFSFIILTLFSFNQDFRFIINIVISVGTISIFDLLFTFYRKKRFYFPKTSIITGFIIGGLLAAQTSLSIIIISNGFAFLSKKIIKYKNKPVFNPAAFGILISALFFNSFYSWWIAFSPLLVFTLGILSIHKFKRLELPLSFLIFFYTLNAFTSGNLLDFSILLNPAILFFSFFMLTEPKTTPIKRKDRIIYSFITSLLIFSLTNIFPTNNFIIGLLISNIAKHFY